MTISTEFTLPPLLPFIQAALGGGRPRGGASKDLESHLSPATGVRVHMPKLPGFHLFLEASSS